MCINFPIVPGYSGRFQREHHMHHAQFLRRKSAGGYLKNKFGFGSERSLAKLACLGGGPEFRKAGPIVLYEPAKLDEWALRQIGKPQRSTSHTEAA
jgi:hypothetical protein